MTFTRKDVAATALTALAVLVFFTAHEGWNVWLVGGSHRWAAGAITLIGMLTCGLGSPGKDAATFLLAALGVLALVLAIVAMVGGSLTVLLFLTLDMVVLWAVSMIRHAGHGSQRAVSA